MADSTSVASQDEHQGRVGGLLKGRAFRAFFKSPSGVASLVVLLALLLDVILAPHFFGQKATQTNFNLISAKPSWSHPLGTNDLGQDTLAQLLVAARLSLDLALLATALAAVVGLSVGLATAIAPPGLRQLLRRVIETMLSFPALLIAIFITAVIGKGSTAPVIGIGVAFSFFIARLTSNLALGVMEREYVDAARVVGVSTWRLVVRYMLPNIAEPLIINIASLAAGAVLVVSALSFLGIGVEPPSIDWGSMLTTGVAEIYATPAAALGPAVAIAVTAIAFGFFGEALARSLNPLLWTGSTGARQPPAAVPVDQAGAGGSRPTGGPTHDAASGKGDEQDDALEVQDLVVTFPGSSGPIEVVKGVSFSLKRGERLAIVGESGSGKTMTALAIAQLTPYPGTADGSIILDGEHPNTLSNKQLDRLLGTDLAVVFQDPMSSLNPALTIGRQLTESARIHRGLKRSEANRLAVSRLGEVQIPAPERQMPRRPYEFSGGMRQRALIAMGLMNDPTLLIADEPTTALDVTIQAQIMSLLNRVNQTHNTAIVLISHNLALVSENCDRVLVMYAGRIVEEIPANLLATSSRHPYTQALIGSVPDFARIRASPEARLQSIPGEMPLPASMPAGCAFHPRCAFAMDRCRSERPELLRIADGQRAACHLTEPDALEAPEQSRVPESA